MNINSVEFVASYARYNDCPDTMLPEFAFVGRSNVGKSSLINTITGRKSIAKVSGTPGKTQLINFFLVNDSWHLVDLPGYGYAKVPRAIKSGFSNLINNYLINRMQMQCAFILIDLNIDPQDIDLEMMNKCGENGIPVALIFTKADKVRPSKLGIQLEKHLNAWKNIWEELPPYFLSSSSDKRGREEILEFIESVVQVYQKNNSTYNE